MEREHGERAWRESMQRVVAGGEEHDTNLDGQKVLSMI